jgi:hypothetical protein
MARYEILEKSFINDRLWQPGEIVEVPDSVTPGQHMKPVDAAAKRRAKEVGLVNGPSPDWADQIAASAAAREADLAASPQGIRSGMNASDPEALNMLSRIH